MCSIMLATSFVSGVRPAAVSSRKSTFAGSSSALNQINTMSIRAPESRVVQVEGAFGLRVSFVGNASPKLSDLMRVDYVSFFSMVFTMIIKCGCFRLLLRHMRGDW